VTSPLACLVVVLAAFAAGYAVASARARARRPEAAPPPAPGLRGILQTRTGDYVHQLGTHGSDLPGITAIERALNVRLDATLGVGSGWRAWLRHAADGLRVSPQGHTVLVDYGDAATVLPNFWATGLGHAAYTRRGGMLFHTRLVVDHFYPARGATAWAERMRAWIAPGRRLLPRRRVPSTPEA